MNLVEYYSERAAEYERIYAKPERQQDLAALAASLKEDLPGADVLEVACGTGYWTERIAPVAKAVTAVDVNEAVLEIARGKSYPLGNVEFVRADCLALPEFRRTFTAGLAAFWWSHVPLAQLDEFLGQFLAQLAPGAPVVFMDNRFVAGNSTPISRTDSDGNSYQQRKLADGRGSEVLKNFPAPDDLRKSLEPFGSVEIEELEYYWRAVLRLPGAKSVEKEAEGF